MSEIDVNYRDANPIFEWCKKWVQNKKPPFFAAATFQNSPQAAYPILRWSTRSNTVEIEDASGVYFVSADFIGTAAEVEAFIQEQAMARKKLTLEDFPLKAEGTDRCWILGCEAGQRTRGLCRSHYDSARYHGVLDALTAQIDARSEAPMLLEQVKEAVCKPLPGGAIAIVPVVLAPSTAVEGRSESEGPILFRPATDPLEWRIQEVEAELRAIKEALTEAVGPDLPPLEQISQLVAQYATQLSINRELEKSLQHAHREAGAEAELRALKEALAEAVGAHPEPLNALQQVALLQRRLARSGQGGELTAPAGEVLLSEANLRDRYARLNEIGHAEELLKGLSEPLQGVLRAVLEAEKAKVLRVCP